MNAAGSQSDTGQHGRIGLVTWNVNGLLPCIKRMGGKSLHELLEDFGPDVHIVCLQETKMQRSQLDQSLARPEGWDAFYSFCDARNVHHAGYSGTATFVRQSSRPVDAQEGFASLCCLADMPRLLQHLELYDIAKGEIEAQSRSGLDLGSSTIPDELAGEEILGKKRPARHLDEAPAEEQQDAGLFELLSSTTPEHLRALDSEGRCVCTDHGDFVLLNCYFPAVRSADKFQFKLDTDRFLFKLRFNIFLHQALARLRSQGRRVVLVGDINIACERLDSACSDDDPDFDLSLSRVWFGALLKDQGLVDVFRHFHPKARVYTCWNQQTGARLTNYGTRLDYVLADKRLIGDKSGEGVTFADCEIEGHEGSHQRGSDHCPVLAWMELESRAALPSRRWWAAKEADGAEVHEEFSREAFSGSKGEREPPAMCATFLPEARSKQTSITSMFSVQTAAALKAPTSEGNGGRQKPLRECHENAWCVARGDPRLTCHA